MRRQLATLVATLASAATGAASAQEQERPAVTVAPFEYGTVALQISEAAERGRLGQYGVHDAAAFAAFLGAGAAELVVEQLIKSNRFRVFERSHLDAIRREHALASDSDDTLVRARYILAGSITRLGLNNKQIGGVGMAVASGALLGRMVGIDTKQSTTTVHLTVRVVDTRTGEIIGSFTGEGRSKKRWGATAFGVLTTGMGGARVADTDFRESAVGEATARAAVAIAEQVIALRATRLRGG